MPKFQSDWKTKCLDTLWSRRLTPECSGKTRSMPWLLMTWLLIKCDQVISSHGIDYAGCLVVKQMLTVCRQQHSFSTPKRMFLWTCHSFQDRKCLDLWGTRTPTFLFTWAIRARHLLSHVFEYYLHLTCGRISITSMQMFPQINAAHRGLINEKLYNITLQDNGVPLYMCYTKLGFYLHS